jgi:hypothetical protein
LQKRSTIFYMESVIEAMLTVSAVALAVEGIGTHDDA